MYAPLRNVKEGNFSLQELNNLEVKELIPAILYISILMVCGVIGNALVLFIYYFRFKPSNHRYFILTLGVCDFITSAVCMPFLMADALHPFTFTSIITCKIFRYVTYNTALISIFTLFVIAVERYRKICKPLESQLTLPLARRILVGIVLLTSIVFALPSFILFGHTSVSTGYGNVSGVACFTDDQFCDTHFPVAYNSALFAIVFILGTVMVFCYTKIAHQRYIRAKFTKARKKYLLIENSGTFISEPSENNLHTSAINGLKEEFRETFSDQTTQTNDSVLLMSKTSVKKTDLRNESPLEVNGKFTDRNNRSRYKMTETFKCNNHSDNTVLSKACKCKGNEHTSAYCDVYSDFSDDKHDQINVQHKDTMYNVINKYTPKFKNDTTYVNTLNFNGTNVTCRDTSSSAVKEIDGLKQKQPKMFQKRRRHSFSETLVKLFSDYDFEGKWHSLSCDTLDLNLNASNKTTPSQSPKYCSKVNEDYMSTFTKAESLVNDINHQQSEMSKNDREAKVHMTKISFLTNGVPKTSHCCKDEQQHENKTNHRNRKVFIRRSKTKSAKFVKLRDNYLITVTKMLFYITLVYFISFIPHLVLMITLMLDDKFLSSLSRTDAPLFYIALRSFLINAVANPFIYNFMDQKFRKEFKNLFSCNIGTD